jgi:hypothetical protein
MPMIYWGIYTLFMIVVVFYKSHINLRPHTSSIICVGDIYLQTIPSHAWAIDEFQLKDAATVDKIMEIYLEAFRESIEAICGTYFASFCIENASLY